MNNKVAELPQNSIEYYNLGRRQVSIDSKKQPLGQKTNKTSQNANSRQINFQSIHSLLGNAPVNLKEEFNKINNIEKKKIKPVKLKINTIDDGNHSISDFEKRFLLNFRSSKNVDTNQSSQAKSKVVGLAELYEDFDPEKQLKIEKRFEQRFGDLSLLASSTQQKIRHKQKESRSNFVSFLPDISYIGSFDQHNTQVQSSNTSQIQVANNNSIIAKVSTMPQPSPRGLNILNKINLRIIKNKEPPLISNKLQAIAKEEQLDSILSMQEIHKFSLDFKKKKTNFTGKYANYQQISRFDDLDAQSSQWASGSRLMISSPLLKKSTQLLNNSNTNSNSNQLSTLLSPNNAKSAVFLRQTTLQQQEEMEVKLEKLRTNYQLKIQADSRKSSIRLKSVQESENDVESVNSNVSQTNQQPLQLSDQQMIQKKQQKLHNKNQLTVITSKLQQQRESSQSESPTKPILSAVLQLGKLDVNKIAYGFKEVGLISNCSDVNQSTIETAIQKLLDSKLTLESIQKSESEMMILKECQERQERLVSQVTSQMEQKIKVIEATIFNKERHLKMVRFENAKIYSKLKQIHFVMSKFMRIVQIQDAANEQLIIIEGQEKDIIEKQRVLAIYEEEKKAIEARQKREKEEMDRLQAIKISEEKKKIQVDYLEKMREKAAIKKKGNISPNSQIRRIDQILHGKNKNKNITWNQIYMLEKKQKELKQIIVSEEVKVPKLVLKDTSFGKNLARAIVNQANALKNLLNNTLNTDLSKNSLKDYQKIRSISSTNQEKDKETLNNIELKLASVFMNQLTGAYRNPDTQLHNLAQKRQQINYALNKDVQKIMNEFNPFDAVSRAFEKAAFFVISELPEKQQQQSEYRKQLKIFQENHAEFHAKLISNNLIVKKQDHLFKQYQKEIKQWNLMLIDFQLRMLQEGMDCRNEGIAELIIQIWKLGIRVSADMLPVYLDEEAKQYLLEKALLHMRIEELQAIQSANLQIYKTILTRVLEDEQSTSMLQHSATNQSTVYEEPVISNLNIATNQTLFNDQADLSSILLTDRQNNSRYKIRNLHQTNLQLISINKSCDFQYIFKPPANKQQQQHSPQQQDSPANIGEISDGNLSSVLHETAGLTQQHRDQTEDDISCNNDTDKTMHDQMKRIIYHNVHQENEKVSLDKTVYLQAKEGLNNLVRYENSSHNRLLIQNNQRNPQCQIELDPKPLLTTNINTNASISFTNDMENISSSLQLYEDNLHINDYKDRNDFFDSIKKSNKQIDDLKLELRIMKEKELSRIINCFDNKKYTIIYHISCSIVLLTLFGISTAKYALIRNGIHASSKN